MKFGNAAHSVTPILSGQRGEDGVHVAAHVDELVDAGRLEGLDVVLREPGHDDA